MAENLSSGVRVDGRYVLQVLLGDGTFGDVWRAQELIAQPALMAGHSMGDWPRAIGRLERIGNDIQ